MPKQSKAKWEIDVEAFTVTLTILSSGEKIVSDLNDLSDDMVRHLALHGWKQLGGDSFAAKDSNPKVNFEKKWATISAGEWSTKREGDGPRISMLVEAVSATDFGTGKELSEIAEMIEKMSADDKKFKGNLSNHPDVDRELKRIQAERAMERAAKAEATVEGSDDRDVSELFS